MSFDLDTNYQIPRPIETEIKIVNKVEKFVTDTCGKRPPSHNQHHMMKVRDNAVWIVDTLILTCYSLILLIIATTIYLNILHLLTGGVISCIVTLIVHDNYDSFRLIVEIVALLHDVADHKYLEEDIELLSKRDRFLSDLVEDESLIMFFRGSMFASLFSPKMIVDIIDRISFSNQKKYGTTDWVPTLGYTGTLVRNVVSDADKFEAIGKAGIDRCIDYTREVYERKNETKTREEMLSDVEKHYHEKLKLLATTTYMKTPPGWVYSKMLNREMRSYLDALKSDKH